MIKYKYAYNSNGIIIDIEQLSIDSHISNENFSCINCGNTLIPKLKGEGRSKHFAHKSKTIKCSRETYLHHLGKKIFYETYLKCLDENMSFIIEYSYPKICGKYKNLLKKKCNKGWLKKEDDLTINFDAIKFEKKEDDFIPDLLIYNTNNTDKKIYIEIAVTHFLSNKKKRSKNLIIEIPVESEKDIERIESRRITELNASFFNFDRTPAPVSDSECDCSKKMFYCLFVYDSGKCIMKHEHLLTLEAERNKKGQIIKYSKIYNREQSYYDDEPEPGMIFVNLVHQAHERGFYLKNCFLCKYSGENWDAFSKHGAYCKIDKKAYNSNKAVDCDKFRLPKN